MLNIELYNKDCFNHLETLPDKSIKLFLLDLPYGCIIKKWDVKIDLDKMWLLVKQKLKKDGLVIFFCNYKFSVDIYNSNPSWFRHDYIWQKKNTLGYLSPETSPLIQHELIHIYFNLCSNNDVERIYNKETRKYAEKYYDYLRSINIKLKDIEKLIGNMGYSHFYSYRGCQFSLPNEKNYNLVSKTYNIDKQPFYLSYKDLRDLHETININDRTYNHGVKFDKTKMTTENKRITSNYGEKKKFKYKRLNNVNYPTTILNYGYDKQNLHTTQKPIKLLEYLINLYTNENEVVCDFCAGSASVAIACINTNRHFTGCELDKDIFNIANNRIKEHIKNNNLVKYSF